MIARVSNAQVYDLLTRRAGALEVEIRKLQEAVSSGQRFQSVVDDPAAAASAVRGRASLAALGQYSSSSSFGSEVLGAQDKAIGEAVNLVVRAEEIASQQSSGLISPADRAAAAEEVHGILQALTTIGNTELSGRRIFGGLALDSPAPFTDPDAGGYDPTTAYVGSTQTFSVKIGSSATERVRITTSGDAVFQDALVGVKALEDALATNGDVAGTLAGLATGRATLLAQRASVGARQAQLVDRVDQVGGLQIREQQQVATALDANLVDVISQLTQLQTALQATLASGAQIAQTSLASLISI
jgi:flagellin-like hook-associated protein FlgL